MQKTVLILLFFPLALLSVLAGGAQGNDQIRIETRTPQHVSLAVGKSTVIDSPAIIQRVSVADTAIADTVVLSPRQVYLVAKALGTTTVTLWQEKERLLTIIDVEVSADLSRLKERLHQLLPGEPIQVTAAHDAVALSGTVSSTAKLSQALAVAEAFAPKKVMNFLQVAGVHQVMLEVRIAEVSRSLGRRLGFNFTGATEGGAFGVQQLKGLTATASPISALALVPPFTAIGPAIDALFRFNQGGVTWTGFIDALKENGLVKILAEPTLVALSGQEANFLAGGEFPVPIPQQGDTITIEFKPFGVGLVFTPTVLSEDKISMKVTPEVSELDFSNAVSFGGFVIPGLSTRRASTAIELADGQSFAIAGLLNESVRENVAKFPILGDIPILGALFRSTSFQKNETELVIIVTPHLVKPLDMAKQPLPTDQYREPNDFDWYLMGRMEGRGTAAAEARPRPVSSLDRTEGFDGRLGYITPQGETR